MNATPQSKLGGQLLRGYVAAMLLGLLLFAAFAVIAIDRALRSSLDERLATAAQASSAFIDIRHGRIEIDADDRKQFEGLLGVQADGAVFDSQGALLLSNTASLPPSIYSLAAPGLPERYVSAGSGESAYRAYALPVRHERRRIGTIVIWRPSDWIEELDRSSAIAFGIAALVIAALALVVGSAVTRRALEDAFDRQRRFTADASHELRAPLAVIRAEADLALRRERSGEIYRNALTTIATEADRIESLIDDLLAAARAESGTLQRMPVDVAAMCTRIVERIRPAAAAKNIALTLETEDGASAAADSGALERALLAIVHNAVKYAPQGGRVALTVNATPPDIEIVVRDDGPGFSQAALEHAFERFWRDDVSRTADGTGLGLAIAKSIVDAFGGTVSLGNLAGAGAEVRCRIPGSS
ncbi:MAG: sensor histidine kinase [Vulcanimicrobiaceae bacterium]